MKHASSVCLFVPFRDNIGFSGATRIAAVKVMAYRQ
jgi:hypothetical protein